MMSLRKCRNLVSISLMGALAFPPNSTFAQSSHHIEHLLKQSIFVGKTPPKDVISGVELSYDPVVLSVIASVKSREPRKESRRWQEVPLPPIHSSICPGPMTALLKHSETGSKYTFVVLPGSYAAMSRGSFTNQTAALLDKKFNDPNIISFSGYLSPQFLRGTCSRIPWDGVSISNDFYERLSQLLALIGADQDRTGLIGFSGGGFLTIGLLAADAEALRHGEGRRFGLGGMAFSPILHARTVFANLDSRHQRSQIDRKLGLTTMDFGNLLFMAKNAWSLLNSLWETGSPELPWPKMLEAYNANPEVFIDRTFNEFVVVDLADTLKAVGVKPASRPLTYYSSYVIEGFQREVSVPRQDVDKAFDQATDVGQLLSQVDRPLLVYFSKDDPVLSNADSADQPETITAVLTKGAVNPWVTVFNPTYGAHTGALLDPIFDDLVNLFFSSSETELP